MAVTCRAWLFFWCGGGALGERVTCVVMGSEMGEWSVVMGEGLGHTLFVWWWTFSLGWGL